ncbi:MAG: hypothetical protein IJH81_07675 [Lachnospiraceae bacterium]|nr:hypothetical protein [Lachnospiraceae bacterium]
MDHLIVDKWTSLPGKAETVLLSAPFTFPPAPSIALSVFKSCLTEAGLFLGAEAGLFFLFD